MDWFSWLSKTGLDPTLVYRYGVAFAQNELEPDDLPYFNHEFLQSMGISIAKHRLEILKLAAAASNIRRRPVSRILISAVKRTRRCFSKYLRAWSRRDDSLALVPVRSCSRRRKESIAKRNSNSKRVAAVSKPIRTPPLLLTNGSPMLFGSCRINSFASPNFECDSEGEFEADKRLVDIRWDTMFQDLKPT